MPDQQPLIKLYYFPLRARAETARLILVYGGAKYEDIRVPVEQWATMKSKMPMGQMPVLEVDGKQLCQSTAIARYLAREYGIAGKTNWDMARADMLVDAIFDMWGHLRNVYTAKMQGDSAAEEENWKTFSEEQLKPFLDRYSVFLNENKSGWFVGDAVTWADIAIAEFFSVLQDCFNDKSLNSHPQLKNFVDKVFALPRLNEYVNKRPKTAF